MKPRLVGFGAVKTWPPAWVPTLPKGYYPPPQSKHWRPWTMPCPTKPFFFFSFPMPPYRLSRTDPMTSNKTGDTC